MSVITIPKPLRERLGDDGVDALIAVINDAKISSREDLATKSDIRELKMELLNHERKIDSIKSDLELKMGTIRSDLELKIESVRSDLELKIEKSKSDTLKWMFLFWAGQLLAMFAMLKAFIK
ncbi:LA_3696 family protein [Candidatus Magnetominusculus xianensis]|uniref:DUF1640 domain-containing protein n=1 Tax=Candidatus Magnetominusculus xianensis TaxID=1748249 RepID=A0ABR5SFL3_9BACT|nr:hypothetical protein [Candidatus Magnetominusculus xianensis]KWT83388.1 hypothetical protein ASN18_2263 [Candidatus Magnetominusculus xianensis]MBF0405590.1 hypothetical protein [Nitrospirota bacterium]